MFGNYSKIWFYIENKNKHRPEGFTHGGTIWNLTLMFVDFIRTGQKRSGIYAEHWGYSEKGIKEIENLAVELGYL